MSFPGGLVANGIRVQDDDLEQSPDRETVRVSLAEGALPPGLEFQGPDYYVEADETGEAVIRGTIGPHSAAEPTQYYLPRFRAWDANAGVCPFICAGPPIGVTGFSITHYELVPVVPAGAPPIAGSGTQSDPWQIPVGRSVEFELRLRGVGASGAVPKGNLLTCHLYDDDPWPNPDDLLAKSWSFINVAGGKFGAWDAWTRFALQATWNEEIEGPDGRSGESEVEIYVWITWEHLWRTDTYEFYTQTSYVNAL